MSRVLLVDDDVDLTAMLGQYLSQEGFRVDAVHDGSEGVRGALDGGYALVVLDSMLPMGRKARLWELFSELFAEISREAEDDFEALFGREFVRAYEQQISRLHQDKS